jgi:hypothetical protein
VQVEVINTTREALEGASLDITTMGLTPLRMVDVSSIERLVQAVSPCSVAVLPESRIELAAEGVTFVFLWLHSRDGQLLSRNVYWLPDQQASLCRRPVTMPLAGHSILVSSVCIPCYRCPPDCRCQVICE